MLTDASYCSFVQKDRKYDNAMWVTGLFGGDCSYFHPFAWQYCDLHSGQLDCEKQELYSSLRIMTVRLYLESKPSCILKKQDMRKRNNCWVYVLLALGIHISSESSCLVCRCERSCLLLTRNGRNFIDIKLYMCVIATVSVRYILLLLLRWAQKSSLQSWTKSWLNGKGWEQNSLCRE